jgi:DNA-binding XRE family transcriptional regulator/molybdate-binding protein
MNSLRARREAAGLTQEQLAARAGVSRQLVGAAEAGRHVPRVDAALALAAALGAGVEELFGGGSTVTDVVSGTVPADGSLVRVGWVGDRMVSAPARVGGDGWDAADGTVAAGQVSLFAEARPGLVVAGCEPGLETLERLLRQGGLGAVSVATSSRAAQAALAAGRVHAAVIHGPADSRLRTPDGVVAFALARWRVGLSVPDGIGPEWWEGVVAGSLSVVQREHGAAVQQAFEDATGGVRVPGRRVTGHVAAARDGSAAGLPAVTIEPAARSVGSPFHALDTHAVWLWVAEEWLADRAVEAALAVITGRGFRRQLEAIGGYELDELGSPVR